MRAAGISAVIRLTRRFACFLGKSESVHNRIVTAYKILHCCIGVHRCYALIKRMSRCLARPKQKRQIHHTVDNCKSLAFSEEMILGKLRFDIIGGFIVHSSPCSYISAIRLVTHCKRIGGFDRNFFILRVARHLVKHNGIKRI